MGKDLHAVIGGTYEKFHAGRAGTVRCGFPKHGGDDRGSGRKKGREEKSILSN